MEESLVEESESGNACTDEAAPALIAVHPTESSVVVAVGSELRVFDLKEDCAVSPVDDLGGPHHSASIRAISFSFDGELFVSAGDDKIVKIWKTGSWNCIHTIQSEKRVSAVSISQDSGYVTFADKFGVVWIMSLKEDRDTKAVPILGHYCSIITSMKFSPDGRFIATADRDHKIRITVFPRNALKGAHEIQSFCLGHTDFVSCLTFVCTQDQSKGFLLSGGGDLTVRLWDYSNGTLLYTCALGNEAGILEASEIEENNKTAVTDICASSNGSLIAVAVQSYNGVMLLSCDFSARTLSCVKKVPMEKSYIPTSLALVSSKEHLWTVMGASNLSSSDLSNNKEQLLTRVRIVSFIQKDFSDACSRDPVLLEDSQVPGGEKLLMQLQGSLDAATQEAAFAAAAAAVRTSLQNMMIKKQYSVERRELRKRNRNDKKIKS
ncbi:tRNA (guanine-N(7)-)-methyltransferase non-catalytic subunit wdr4 [Carex littledalei]|uniref:tRNA (guanine-N(7)-)-methyltransferase non-catalytic subunit n=1 Tax=Carex littledalei TaxID=544730 RepID=A0A833QNU1_9POAL|nr:tRNA (guanine-N(7)-)-methyltransferase non-catalytic subunit wdr4 [Carex littledalei]